MSAGQLLGIAYKSKRRASVETSDTAHISEATGLVEDHRGAQSKGRGARQITVVDKSAWDKACSKLGADLPWTYRRANLLVSGLDLYNKTGCRLVIGNVVLEITGETEPCARMDEQYDGLRAALGLDWRAGASCRVIEGGDVRVGNPVHLDLNK